jgi:type I restriction enzyme R subunit
VLYLARRLRGHTLLQALARVNRLHEAKTCGLILDYSGVIQDLGRAVDFYNQLADYDPADLEATVNCADAVADHLHRVHADLQAALQPLKSDRHAQEPDALLRDTIGYKRFVELFNAFADALRLALSLNTFLASTPGRTLEQYNADYAFCHQLKATVGRPHQQRPVYSTYENPISQLIDTHVGAGPVEQLCEPVDLQDAGWRRRAGQQDHQQAAGGDRLMAAFAGHFFRNRLVIDPLNGGKFSNRLEQVIKGYHHGRSKDAASFGYTKQASAGAINCLEDHQSPAIADCGMTQRFYDCVRQSIPSYRSDHDKIHTRIAVQIKRRLAPYKIRDWRQNPDIINRMRGEIDEILFDAAKRYGIELSLQAQDGIIDDCIGAAIDGDD